MKSFILSLWNESRLLMGACAILLAVFLLSIAGIAFDSRQIMGAPAWLKPMKFAVSTAIFSASAAWTFRYVEKARVKKLLGPLFAFVGVLEVAIISFQAARGTTSHFNVSGAENAILFSIMGVAIGILWLGMIWLTIVLFRQRFADQSWGWALRLGMLLSTVGAGTAGLMLHPTPDSPVGAHTVGAPDGGPGLPVTNWSEQHGDLRIPHFLGLHGMQAIPFALWWMRRRRIAFHETKAVFAVSASYLALTMLLGWQALRGESIADPGALTATALAVWLGATVAGLVWSRNNLKVKVAVI